MQAENEARVFFRGISENESFARLFTAGFFSQLDPTLTELTDLKTAVSEAVTNAIIHGYDGFERQERMVELCCAYRGREAYIEVADTGRGIADIEKAREPLFTSKPEMERSGMGFTIMETFMDEIRVESKPNEGTRVYMKKTLSAE